MRTKKFIVRADYPENTKWLLSDRDFSQLIASQAEAAMHLMSTGPKPAVTARFDGDVATSDDQTHRRD